MTRLQFLICATTLMLSSSSLLAQSGTIAVTIRTEPAGAQFTVDGVVYRSGTVMTWQAGSSHVLNIPLDDPNQALLSGVRYMFTGWTWEGSGVPPEQKNVVVTAGSGVASYTATFRKEYAVGVEFEPHQRVPPGLTPHCETLAQAGVGSARGVVAFDGVCYWGMTTKWVAEGTPVTARATALPGYVFTGWKMPGSLPIMSEQVSVPVIRPTTLTATFEAGRRLRGLQTYIRAARAIDDQCTPGDGAGISSGSCSGLELGGHDGEERALYHKRRGSCGADRGMRE